MSKITKKLPDIITEEEEDTVSTSQIKKIKTIAENSDDSDSEWEEETELQRNIFEDVF